LLRGVKTNKSSSLPGVNKIEEKIEKQVLKSPKHLLYFQTKIKFVKGPPPEQSNAQKTLKPKQIFATKTQKSPFKRKKYSKGGHKFAEIVYK